LLFIVINFDAETRLWFSY